MVKCDRPPNMESRGVVRPYVDAVRDEILGRGVQ